MVQEPAAQYERQFLQEGVCYAVINPDQCRIVIRSKESE